MTGSLAFRLRNGFLIVSVLSGCASRLKPFPTDHLIEYDNKSKVCGYYKITDPENLKFKYVNDVPCPAVFGFESKDIPNILNWSSDALDYVKNNCK